MQKFNIQGYSIMISANTLRDMREHLNATIPQGTGEARDTRLVGILLAPPESEIAKKEIVPRLEDFHHRSGTHVDFFCVGYGACWPVNEHADAINAKTLKHQKKYSTDWTYSSQIFHETLKEMEKCASKYKYNGESELVLLNAYRTDPSHVHLDFEGALVLNLTKLKTDHLIGTVSEFFHQIFQYAEHQDPHDPTWALSDVLGQKKLLDWMQGIASTSPLKELAKLWKTGRHFAILDLTGNRTNPLRLGK